MRCLVCKSVRIKFKYKINHFDYYLCLSCGSLQLNKIKPYKYSYSSFNYKIGFQNEKRIRLRACSIITELSKIKKNITSILDVGCGAGFMLDEFKNYSSFPVGIEPSKSLSAYAKRNFKIQIYNGYLDSDLIKRINQKFDVVILSHILEHLSDPLSFLNLVDQILKKAGLIYIETPNINSWQARIEKSKYTFLTPPEHFCLYTRKGVIDLLNNANLKYVIKKEYTYSDGEHIIGFLRKLKRILLKENKMINKHVVVPKSSNKSSNKNKFDLLFPIIAKRIFNSFFMGSYMAFYIEKK